MLPTAPGQPPQMPPSVAPAPAHAGPATMGQGNPGNVAAAMMQIKNAVEMLQKALPAIPMGTPLHEKVLKVTGELAKELSQTGGGENQALQLQSLVQQLRSQSQQQPLSALSKLYPNQQPSPALPQAGEPAAAA
jgi:hypothetical protein